MAPRLARALATYLLGFYPNPSKRDHSLHDLRVEVSRSGVRVRARAPVAAEPD